MVMPLLFPETPAEEKQGMIYRWEGAGKHEARPPAYLKPQ